MRTCALSSVATPSARSRPAIDGAVTVVDCASVATNAMVAQV